VLRKHEVNGYRRKFHNEKLGHPVLFCKEVMEAQWTGHVEDKKYIQNFWYGRLLESYHFST
jgi:hypothetical protein